MSICFQREDVHIQIVTSLKWKSGSLVPTGPAPGPVIIYSKKRGPIALSSHFSVTCDNFFMREIRTRGHKYLHQIIAVFRGACGIG